MAVLTAVVVVLALALVLNLTLTFGVIRRLKEQSAHPAHLPANLAAPEPAMLPAGSVVHEFMALTVDDEPISRESLTATTLVAFLSTHCSSCRAAVPDVVAMARSMPGGRDRVLAVIVDDVDATDDAVFEEFHRELAGVARVARDVDGGQIPVAFGLQGFPAICVVDEGGVVRSSGYDFDEVDVPAVATR